MISQINNISVVYNQRSPKQPLQKFQKVVITGGGCFQDQGNTLSTVVYHLKLLPVIQNLYQ